jgi:hypothetical protein
LAFQSIGYALDIERTVLFWRFGVAKLLVGPGDPMASDGRRTSLYSRRHWFRAWPTLGARLHATADDRGRPFWGRFASAWSVVQQSYADLVIRKYLKQLGKVLGNIVIQRFPFSMKKPKPPFNVIRNHVLRQNQAVLVLDHKGNFKCIWCLRGEKIYQITKYGRNQSLCIPDGSSACGVKA